MWTKDMEEHFLDPIDQIRTVDQTGWGLNTVREQETDLPGLMALRTDSITSTTQFVNPNHVQPANLHGYSGVHQGPHHGHQGVQGHQQESYQYQGGQDEAQLQPDKQENRTEEVSGEDGLYLLQSPYSNPNSESVEESSNSNQSCTKQEELDQVVFYMEGELYSSDAFLPHTPLHLFPDAGPSSTGLDVSTKDYPGQFEIAIKFKKDSKKNKQWEYSNKLKKLFIDVNKWIQIDFTFGRLPPPNLCIRTLPVFSEASSIRETVKRCPNHSSPEDATNQEFVYPNHLIRYANEDTLYEENTESGRLSTIFSVGTLHQGTDVSTRMMKFMCLGSDVGGINRRPIKIIFTLEIAGNVVGRKVVDVRVCSCPRRDLQQEELRQQQQEDQARSITQRFAETAAVPQFVRIQPPPGKKLKTEKNLVVMVPVHVDDFRKINEFAECAWVCRDPANADTIKETRSRLLMKHNDNLLKQAERDGRKKN